MNRINHRKDVINVAHKLASRSWVANHDGNISVKLAANRFLATPTATHKSSVGEDNLIEVNDKGTRIAGTARPFSEIAMHLAVFAARPDVGAVVHAHPPYATAIACSGSNCIEQPCIAEAIVSLGPSIPTLAATAPGPDAVSSLQSKVTEVDAVLVANHGVFTWGATLELAYLRMELVEHLAKITTLAMATGGVQPLAQSVINGLLASRAKANLGLAADRAMEWARTPVFACAPAPQAIRPSVSRDREPQLSAIIRDELSKILHDS